MALVKILQQQATYKEDYFEEIVRNVVGESGPLSGFEVREKEVGGKIYAVISPGSFIVNNKIYIYDEEIDGSNLSLPHSLELTPFADDPNFMMQNTLLYSGRESVFLVETNVRSGGDPIFSVKLLIEVGDILISQRKVDWYIREDADPLSYDVLVAEEGDGNTAVFATPIGEFLISGTSDFCAPEIGSYLDPSYDLVIE